MAVTCRDRTLRRHDLHNAISPEHNLDDAVITGAHFFNVPFGSNVGLTAEQIRTTWNYKNDRMQGIVLPKEIADSLSGK